jgi:magnesium chelatase family protein
MVKPFELIQPIGSESSHKIKQRVNRARDRQQERFTNTNIYFNSRMNPKQIRRFCRLNQQASRLLKQAINELGFSARAYDKILKVSLTIADLSEQDEILAEHIAEAIQYHSLDKNLWL